MELLQSTKLLDYFKQGKSNFTLQELEKLIGILAFLQDVDTHYLADIFAVPEMVIISELEQLLDADVILGEFIRENFILISHNANRKKPESFLSEEDYIFFLILKCLENVTVTKLSRIYREDELTLIEKIGFYLIHGFITDVTHEEDHFRVEFERNFQFSGYENSLLPVKHVLGYFLVRPNSSVKQCSFDLQKPQVVITLSLAHAVFSSDRRVAIRHENGELTVSVSTEDREVLIEPTMLTDRQRAVLGYIGLSKNVSLGEVTGTLKISRIRLLEIVSEFAYESNIPFIVSRSNMVYLANELRFTFQADLSSLNVLSLFDYNSLLGIIAKSSLIKINEIANTINTSPQELLMRIIDLYIFGLIEGERVGSKFKLRRRDDSHGNTKQANMSRWELIIVGALIAKGRMTWPEIRTLLKIDREAAIQRAYSIFTKMSPHIKIYKDKALEVDSELQMPQLQRVHSLKPSEKVIFGYAINNKRFKISKLAKIVGLSQIDVLSSLFYLNGSGLLLLKIKGSTAYVQWARSIKPLLSVEKLDSMRQLLYKSLPKQGKSTKIKDLMKLASLDKYELLRILYILSAEGYINFKISRYSIYAWYRSKKEIPLGCLYCGSLYDVRLDHCEVCLRVPPTCIICKGVETSGDSIAGCPKCGVTGHLDHFSDWINLRPICPNCQTSLNVKQLTQNLSFGDMTD